MHLKHALVTVLPALLLVAQASGCSVLEKTIRKYGYDAVRPPSELFGPGAILAPGRDLSNGAVSTRTICFPEESLGPEFAPKSSPTAEIAQKINRKGTFKLAADFRDDLISATSNGEYVKDITLKISNAKVVSLSDAQVIAAKGNRSDACEQARTGTPDRDRLYMIREALIADVEYVVSFKGSTTLDAAMKAGVVKALGASLGASLETASETSVSGTALVWGVVPDRYLATIAKATDAAPGPKVEGEPTPFEVLVVPDRASEASRVGGGER